MGKRKERFNSRARNQKEVVIDTSWKDEVKLDKSSLIKDGKYDESNELILPSKKRKTLIKKNEEKVEKILSKKQRKKLEKIVERRQKKRDRVDLYEELQKYQTNPTSATVTEKFEKVIATSTKRKKKKKPRKLKVLLDPSSSSTSTSLENSKNSLNLQTFNDQSDTSSEEEEEEEEKEEKIDENPKLTIFKKNTPLEDVDNEKEEETIIPFIPKIEDSEAPPPAEISKKIEIVKVDRKFVLVNRTKEIEKIRSKLPIIPEEQVIIEAINDNLVVIISGETGSGKTTQLPQFLYEAGYAQNGKLIGITEPRRVAAISMSMRVSQELNLPGGSGGIVSYQIRFEGNVSEKTKIKFMTDGVLLKEMEKDFLLQKYSVICIDEAHERSLYTDILIGLLSRCIILRNKRKDPLRLVIMSATMRIQDFKDNQTLFPPNTSSPILIEIPVRQFPVQTHFSKTTPENYLSAALKKISQIHKKLPPGGILVFVTGQHEVKSLIKQLHNKFNFIKKQGQGISLDNFENEEENGNENEENEIEENENEVVDDEILFELEDDEELHKILTQKKNLLEKEEKLLIEKKKLLIQQQGLLNKKKKIENNTNNNKKSENSKNLKNPKILPPLPKLLNFDLDKINTFPNENESENEDEDSDEENEEEEDEEFDKIGDKTAGPLHLLPLYSMLPNKDQQKVFQGAPEGSRLVVVSTNVAETSLTIPSIRYVVDCGKVKAKLWDKMTGVEKFEVGWCSKASAEQRTGRAGRVGPGHSYRLFSSAVFQNDFKEYSNPEILTRPIEDIFLLMKAMAIVQVKNFPFPTPPEHGQLEAAENLLLELGAVEKSKLNLTRKIPGKKSNLIARASRELTKITDLGKTMAHFPIGPRFAKMLALSFQHSLVQHTITLVSALSVQEALLNSEGDQGTNWANIRRKWIGTGSAGLLGDCMVLLRAVGAFEFAGGSPDFCSKWGLRYKSMVEIRKLRRQLTNEINLLMSGTGNEEIVLNPKMPPPTEEECDLLRQLILSGNPDRIARKIQPDEINSSEDKIKLKHAYRCLHLDQPVYLEKYSALRSSEPSWVVYQEVYENESNQKIFLRNVIAIDPAWIKPFANKELVAFY